LAQWLFRRMARAMAHTALWALWGRLGVGYVGVLHYLVERFTGFTTAQHVCVPTHIGDMQSQCALMIVETDHRDLVEIDDQVAFPLVVVAKVDKVHGAV